jgi:hypothetical protein
VRRTQPHLSHSAKEYDDRGELLTDLRDSLAVMRRARFTGACAEGATAEALDADVVRVAFGLVRHFKQARLVTADALRLVG